MGLILNDVYEIGHQVADDPLVWVVDDFVTESEREHILQLATGRMTAAKVSQIGDNVVSEKRTGSTAWIAHDQTPTIRDLVARVSALVAVPATHAESLQVVHYAESQEYRPHYDAWDVTTAKGREKTVLGGNRLVTALMYLNEVEGGGATVFPNLELEIDALPGRMCIFHNLSVGDGHRHVDGLHGGMAVTAGEKWACNLWFREHRYQQRTATSRTGGGAPRPVRRKQRR